MSRDARIRERRLDPKVAILHNPLTNCPKFSYPVMQLPRDAPLYVIPLLLMETSRQVHAIDMGLLRLLFTFF